MKIILHFLFFSLLLNNSIFSQTINSSFQINKISNSRLAVKVQIDLQQGTAVLGNSVIRFTFDTAAISFNQYPIKNIDYVFQNLDSTDYSTSISLSSSGTVSINIAQISTNYLTITTNYIDIATIYFTIINSNYPLEIQPAIQQYFSPSSSNEWSLGSWNVDSTSILPVELTTFSAYKLEDKVELNWSTATEINNYGFNIERCSEPITNSTNSKAENADSTEWVKIGFVEGNGNSNSPKNYSFTDDNPNRSKIEYRLQQVDYSGNFTYSKILTVYLLPSKFYLSQNYPNPFNPSTTIKYSIPVGSNVVMKLYDVLGKEIKTLVNEFKAPGEYQVQLNANNLPSGIYYYTIHSGSFKDVKKMILLK